MTASATTTPPLRVSRDAGAQKPSNDADPILHRPAETEANQVEMASRITGVSFLSE